MKCRTAVSVATILLCTCLATLVIPAAAVAAPGSAAAASAAGKPKPSPSPSPSPGSPGTFIKAYSAIVGGAQLNLSPVDVQATSDGGYIALSETQSAAGLGVNWLVKLSATGTPQWQEQVGCSSGAPGDYAEGVSVEQTADGGYVVAGGTIDCGSGSTCPALSGRSCALVERLDATGRVIWAHAFAPGIGGSAINQVRQTADGGFIAAGSFTDSGQNTGALLLKLDGSGNLQWQRDLGPAGSTQAYFNSVQQTADGSYAAAGGFYTPTSGVAPTEVLVAKFGADGTLTWQHGFSTLDASRAPASAADAASILQTPDGGFAVAGRWSDQSFNGGNGARGALLLKLDAAGTLQWQKAYSGGVYCFFNGFSETCTDIGSVAYTVHQTSDGGFVLAGDENLEQTDGAPIEAWLAKVDASGNLLWQHLYYQTSAAGRPLGEFFPGSVQAPDGGFLAVGPTLNYATQKDELFAVKTDASGLVGTCGDVHQPTALQAIDPQLTAVDPALPAQAATSQPATSAITTQASSIGTSTDC